MEEGIEMVNYTDSREAERARQQLRALLGDLPAVTGPVTATTVAVEEREHFVLQRLVLDLNGIEPVPALLTHPKESHGKLPLILFNHSHGGNYVLGKDELIRGNTYMHYPPYAEVLAKRGIAALAIDHWNFGERRGRTESELFKEMLWQGQVLWGMMVYDSLRAMDYACSLPEVDRERIGTLGMSMGSTMAWWTAALDTRIKVCVDICCLTDFASLVAARGLDGHGLYYYVPGLLKHFSTSAINALIAPRPHLALAGIFDHLTPVQGLDAIDAALQQVYSAHGAPSAWRLQRYHVGHVETAAMRADILAFLDRWL
jgi:dienelactone hydrolase